MVILIVISLILLAVPLHDLVRRPTFRRLAIRNVLRRKTEAAIVVLGAALGTAIITAAFITGNSFDQSIRNIAKTDLGPIDIGVEIEDATEVAQVRDAVVGDGLPGTDGVLSSVSIGTSVVHPDAPGGQRAEPQSRITEFDIDEARDFGGRPDDTGLAGVEAIGEGETVIVQRLARTLDAEVGDQLTVFAYGQEIPLTVTAITPTRGLMGSAEMVVVPGTIEGVLATAGPGAADARPPSGTVLISNNGGIFDGANGSDAIVDEVVDRVEAFDGVEVGPWKQELIEDAEATGTELSTLFTGIGSFSVIAGILLLVNLFVMLAEERKTEMGMLRAVGLKRNHLTRSFVLEGAAYAALSAVVGAIGGIAVGWGIVQATQSIFADDDGVLDFTLAIRPETLVVGGLVGFVIAGVTAWLTSLRISGLNIISAIRDLPNPRSASRRLRSLVAGVAGVALGVLLTVIGYGNPVAVLLMMGPPIALLSAITLISRFLPRRPVVLVLAGLALVYGATVFQVFPEQMEDGDIEVFVVMGVVLTAAAVAIVTALDKFWGRMISASGGALAPRLALAYPLNRLFRTGLLLGMFSLVIFTMTFITALDGTFSGQGPTFARDLAGGYDMQVRSNPANPITVEDLEGQPGVERVATIQRGFPELRPAGTPEEDSEGWAIAGINDAFLEGGVPLLTERDPAYGSDVAAYEAVLADPSLIIVNTFLGGDDGGPDSGSDIEPGDQLILRDPVSARETEMTVAGVYGGDFVFFGSFASAEAVQTHLDISFPSRHLVKVADGLDAQEVAADLTGRFIANGGDAETFTDAVNEEVQAQSGFFSLMRGYLGLGLLIGIAGLAVVMVRAVRERRRQIGMLRAMGVTSPTVRGAFLAESGFIALQGIIIGVALGLVTSWSVITSSDSFGDEELSFTVPWLALVLIVAIPLVAVIASTVVPAMRAASIRPAAALRIAD